MAERTTTPSSASAWIITGPTSGIGRHTALELAKHGTVVLVGRNRRKLDEVRKEIEAQGGQAVSVVCDLSDVVSARRAAVEIAALELPSVSPLSPPASAEPATSPPSPARAVMAPRRLVTCRP